MTFLFRIQNNSIYWEIKSQLPCLYAYSVAEIIFHRFGLTWGKWWLNLDFWVNYCFNRLVFLHVVHQHKFYSVSSFFNDLCAWTMYIWLNASWLLLCIFIKYHEYFRLVLPLMGSMRTVGQMPVWSFAMERHWFWPKLLTVDLPNTMYIYRLKHISSSKNKRKLEMFQSL